MKLYFDTNVWINYLWGTRTKQAKLKGKTKKLFECVENKNLDVVFSVFASSEISAHFRDWYILQKIIKKGFGYRELSNLKRQKEYNKITDKQKATIEKYIKKIASIKWVETVQIKKIEGNALELFETLTIGYHLDFADAFHLIIAMEENCSMLITDDGSLRENGKEFIKDYDLGGNINIYNTNELINSLQ